MIQHRLESAASSDTKESDADDDDGIADPLSCHTEDPGVEASAPENQVFHTNQTGNAVT